MKLTESGLVFMAGKCGSLQELRLYACSQVTDTCLRAFGKLSQLCLLDLCGGHRATGQCSPSKFSEKSFVFHLRAAGD